MAYSDNDRFPRFGKAARVVHLTHLVSFFVLFLTGMSLYFNFLSPLNLIFGGANAAKLIHRIAALVFFFGPVLAIILNPKGFALVLYQITHWRKEDFHFIARFFHKFFGQPHDVAPQGYLNGGQKLNTYLLGFGCLGLAFTGFVIWFPEYLPNWLVLWCYPLHSLLAPCLTAVVLGHAYLGSFHPGSGASWEAIWGGSLSRAFAEHHHAQWAQEVDIKLGRVKR
ncbi:MAG: cytochrome b/b6 domain-containing protein [Heliobacteriaceae bacterium]|nr:cytochrome b/b6 domain-containing protein [Heliobacteriaceae bacterium]MDD4587396.1 cytochrome b/b6 domain-containing protein [Heliobacteriaceae bacterium]